MFRSNGGLTHKNRRREPLTFVGGKTVVEVCIQAQLMFITQVMHKRGQLRLYTRCQLLRKSFEVGCGSQCASSFLRSTLCQITKTDLVLLPSPLNRLDGRILRRRHETTEMIYVHRCHKKSFRRSLRIDETESCNAVEIASDCVCKGKGAEEGTHLRVRGRAVVLTIHASRQ